MEMRTVTVADRASDNIMSVEVDADRWNAIDINLKESGLGRRILGTDADFKQVTGRRPSAKDAQEAYAFLVSELAYVEQGIYEKFYIPTQWDKFLAGCIDTSAGEGAETVEYEVYDRVSNARETDTAADDAPMSDVAYARKSFPVIPMTSAYEFTQQELRMSAMMRRPLPERRLAAAMEGYQRKLNNLGLFGSASKNVTGLFNNASIPSAVRPSGQLWTGAASTAQILSDVGYGLYQSWLGSAFNTIADTLLIPPNAYQYIANTPASSSIPGITILEFIKKSNMCKDVTGRDLMIEPAYELATAGAGSTGRAMFYPRNIQTLVMEVPMPLRFLAPQYVGYKVKMFGEGRASGVEVRRPSGCYYMDGVQ